MDRRGWFRGFARAIIGSIGLGFVQRSYSQKQTASPQSDAIALVIAKGQADIANAETDYFKANGTDWWLSSSSQYYWHDTISRSWSAIRPIAPGVTDSTHAFIVSYSIKDQTVATWGVDTREKTIRLIISNETKTK